MRAIYNIKMRPLAYSAAAITTAIFARYCTAIRAIGAMVLLLLPVMVSANSGPLLSPGTFQQDTGRDYLVVGKITNNPKKHIHTMSPIANFIAANLGRHGINGAKVKFAKNLEQMIQYINNGDVDYVTETVYGAARMINEANAEPVLLRWKKGQRDYQSIIFTHKNSGINTLDDLRNRTIVFEDEGSTTSYFIPRHELESRNFSLVPLASPNDSVSAGKVGFLFSGSEQNTSALVYSQLAAAGAVNSHDWEKPNHMPIEQRKQFKKLFVSEPLPRSIEMVRPGMARSLRDAIQQLLLAIDQSQDPLAREALKSYQKTRKFEALGKTELNVLNRLATQLSYHNQPQSNGAQRNGNDSVKP